MKDILNKLLTILGILFIIEVIRRIITNDPIDVDVTEIKQRIKDGEAKLEEIENSDYDVESIVDDWNDRL